MIYNVVLEVNYYVLLQLISHSHFAKVLAAFLAFNLVLY